jgi:hypothetical protein
MWNLLRSPKRRGPAALARALGLHGATAMPWVTSAALAEERVMRNLRTERIAPYLVVAAMTAQSMIV